MSLFIYLSLFLSHSSGSSIKGPKRQEIVILSIFSGMDSTIILQITNSAHPAGLDSSALGPLNF
jgi:hypothetical protein